MQHGVLHAPNIGPSKISIAERGNPMSRVFRQILLISAEFEPQGLVPWGSMELPRKEELSCWWLSNGVFDELMAFTQVLGHEHVVYYADNEPTTRQMLGLLVASRTAAGLKTTSRTTRIYDSAGNSLVENAIQRVRSLAATLMEDLAGRIGLRFSSQHPLWSWACRHSAWLINRYQNHKL